jgi:subtilase family protein
MGRSSRRAITLLARRRPFSAVGVVALGGALAVVGSGSAFAGSGPGPAVAPSAPVTGGAASGGRVIVVLKDQHSGLNLRAQGQRRAAAARSDQAPIMASIRAHGGTGITRLIAPNAVAARLPAAEVARLRANPAVAEIVPDARLTILAGGAAGMAGGSELAGRPQEQPAHPAQRLCPANPAKPFLEPEALPDIHASNGSPNAPGEANKIATGQGVIVANDGANELAGNPNFQRPDGSHVVIDAPDYTADNSNDEDYGDVSSIGAQGTVVYDYSKELPFSGLPAGCTFVIKGDAPGASVVDLSQVDTPVLQLSQVIAGIDRVVSLVHADVISESFGTSALPSSHSGQLLAQANEAAVAAGVTVVESSGDSGDSGTMIAAADDPAVIAAGATNTLRLLAQGYGYNSWVDDNITPLSSGGTAPTGKIVDLVAPGYSGEAACNPAAAAGGCPSSTQTEAFGGTSQAAPLIAGAAADVIQAYRDTHGGASPTPAMVKQILTSTATDVDAPAGQQGAGLLDIYAAVRAAQQMPGTAETGGPGDAPALIASPSQLDVTADGGSVSEQTASLYNASNQPARLTGRYRWIGPEHPIGQVVTEPVSAPPPSQPVPAEGAQAAAPVSFTVPPHLNRLDADMIWPDPQNANILSFTLIDPRGRLTQISYDFGTPSTRAGGIGSVPDIQHVEVANPVPGRWRAKILWANGRAHLQSPPNVPGTFTGDISFRVSGQDYLTAPASGPVTVPARSAATIPLHIVMPRAPGDYPESVQFTSSTGAVTSLPVARRTLIPAGGGSFHTLITSTVGRMIGQLNTYEINVPAGRPDLDVQLATADTSADNKYTYFLVDPTGKVVATDTTPKTVNGSPVGTAELQTANPAAGTWQIDVELNLTVSGQEFTQAVNGQVTDGSP